MSTTVSTNTIISTYKQVIVQIATPQSTGTGFLLNEYGLIVTNHHVVEGYGQVVIKGKTFARQFGKVVYLDDRHDIAFIEAPKDANVPDAQLGDYDTVQDGDTVLAIGHPFGLNYTSTLGVISRKDRVSNGLHYIQIDAAINPGNSGGPLVNMRSEVVGVNTFIIRGGDNLGFALPTKYLRTLLEEYKQHTGKSIVSCKACGTLVHSENIVQQKYCPSCGAKIELIKYRHEEPEPVTGIAKVIEDSLTELGHDAELCRVSANYWEVMHNNLKVTIAYNASNMAVSCDAFLAQIPRAELSALYEFLLRENYTLSGMALSTHVGDVILSSLNYDLYMSPAQSTENLRNFFAKCDEYKQVLIATHQCNERLEEVV
jgi:serine protease Do